MSTYPCSPARTRASGLRRWSLPLFLLVAVLALGASADRARALSISIDDIVGLAIDVGVGVERTAAGSDDNPLEDLVSLIAFRFGPGPAQLVQAGFGLLIDQLGPSLLADVPPIVLPPAFDVNSGLPEVASVSLPDAAYILDIGNTQNVGDGALASITLGLVDRDGDDDDAEQILSEIITGTSGANLDLDSEPGIEGVLLVAITLDSYTLDLEDGTATDRLTLHGPGVVAVLASLDAPANIIDAQNDLSQVEVGVEPVVVGTPATNPIFDLIGSDLATAGDVTALLNAGLASDPRVELVSFDASTIALFVRNGATGSADLLVLFGTVVEGVVASLP